MTVGIAVLCENGNAAIIAADRKAVLPNGISIEEEGGKIRQLAKNIVVINSCMQPEGELMDSELRGMVQKETCLDPKQVAETIKSKHGDLHKAKLNFMSMQMFGLKLSEFYELLARLHGTTLVEVGKKFAENVLHLQILIAGAAEGGAYVSVLEGGQLSLSSVFTSRLRKCSRMRPARDGAMDILAGSLSHPP